MTVKKLLRFLADAGGPRHGAEMPSDLHPFLRTAEHRTLITYNAKRGWSLTKIGKVAAIVTVALLVIACGPTERIVYVMAEAGTSDAGPEACSQAVYYRDYDQDGYGSPIDLPIRSCVPIEGYSLTTGDCADEDRDAFPGQTAYYTATIIGTRIEGTPDHDYNCNGQNELGPDAGTCETGGCR